MRARLIRLWWLWLGLAGVSSGLALLLAVSAGRWRVERESLLSDQAALANDQRDLNLHQRHLAYRRFADVLESRIRSGALHEENIVLARWMVARARLQAGQDAIQHAHETAQTDARYWAEALQLIEGSLTVPALYTDFHDPELMPPEESTFLLRRVGDTRLKREQLGALLTNARLLAAGHLARSGNGKDAMDLRQILAQPAQVREPGGALLLHVPSLLQQALEERAIELRSRVTKRSVSARLCDEIVLAALDPLALDLLRAMVDQLEAASLPILRAGTQSLPPALLLADVWLALAQAARQCGDIDLVVHALRSLEEGSGRLVPEDFQGDPYLEQQARAARHALERARFLRAELLRDDALAVLARLAGPRRPLPGQELSDAHALLELNAEAALDAFYALLQTHDPRTRDRAQLAATGLKLDLARYHWQYLPALDPDGLSAFSEPGESIAQARTRLAAGPPHALLTGIAASLDALASTIAYDDDPHLWVATRVRQGQLVEITPDVGMEGRLGRLDVAVREHYLPLAQAPRFAGVDAGAVIANPHVSFKGFFRSWLAGLRHCLALRPPQSESLLHQIGDISLHADFVHAACTIDPTLCSPESVHTELLRAYAALLLHAARPAEEIMTVSKEAAEATLRRLRRDEALQSAPVLWFEAGQDLLAAGDHTRSVLALMRGLELAEQRRAGPPTEPELAAAIHLAAAYERLGALSGTGPRSGALGCYQWVRDAVLPGLSRGELSPSALPAFVGAGRVMYRLAMREGDPAWLELAISHLDAHLVHATVFASPPLDLEYSRIRMEAQMWRGRSALALARDSRDQPEKLRRYTGLARDAFDDVVQRFHDQPDPEVLQAQLLLARVDFMDGLYDPAPLAKPAMEALARADARLRALASATAEGSDLARESLTLTADVLELTGRRRLRLASDGDMASGALGREALNGAIAACIELDRVWPSHPVVASALLHRISCHLLLGQASVADRDAAMRLLETADSALGRVPDEAWQSQPAGMGREYWSAYFDWMREEEAQ